MKESKENNRIWQSRTDLKSLEVDGKIPLVYYCQSPFHEGDVVVDLIQKMISSGQVEPNEIAVLYRNNSSSRFLEGSLARAGIPYILAKGTASLQKKNTQNVISYLKVILNPLDNISLLQIINYPTRGLGKKAIEFIQENLMAESHQKGKSLLEIISEMQEKPEGLTKKAFESLQNLGILFKSWSDLADKDIKAGELIENIIKATDWKPSFVERTDINLLVECMEDISEKVEYDSIQNHTNLKEKLIKFMDTVSLESSLLDSPDEAEKNFVTLSTIHQAKGSEWRKVFLVECSNGILPGRINSRNSYNQRDEEKRVLFVALSRAKEELVITYTKKPSPFLEENFPLSKSMGWKAGYSSRIEYYSNDEVENIEETEDPWYTKKW
eukprot:TRINITY_DN4769_c0_g2_i1.p1 TRINITY_DN4769_c0_g2~~TRINITY_DN4769_c0_g2_i1.p1  ORF type:complete len:383 (+),score=133.67 TRINITY_DN4769_c0_g2_i1:1348-2496(+)